MDKQQHDKNQFQGVTRLFEGLHFKDLLKCYPQVNRWVMSEENNEDGTDYHIHFVIEGDKLALSNFRKFLKDDLLENKKITEDYVFKNGDLNIKKIKLDKDGNSTVDTMIQYILKQGLEAVHNYNTEYIKALKKLSYVPKKISMTKAILKLKEECYQGHIDIEEYGVKYRKIRIDYRKPDPLWYKEIDRMQEQLKNDEQIKKEVREYLQERGL